MYIVTGTRAYGPAREDSDLDIVMVSEDAQILKTILMAAEFDVRPTNPDYVSGYVVEIGPITLNIIEVDNSKDLDIWESRTEAMKRVDPVHDRSQRIEMFNNPQPATQEKSYYDADIVLDDIKRGMNRIWDAIQNIDSKISTLELDKEPPF